MWLLRVPMHTIDNLWAITDWGSINTELQPENFVTLVLFVCMQHLSKYLIMQYNNLHAWGCDHGSLFYSVHVSPEQGGVAGNQYWFLSWCGFFIFPNASPTIIYSVCACLLTYSTIVVYKYCYFGIHVYPYHNKANIVLLLFCHWVFCKKINNTHWNSKSIYFCAPHTYPSSYITPLSFSPVSYTCTKQVALTYTLHLHINTE